MQADQAVFATTQIPPDFPDGVNDFDVLDWHDRPILFRARDAQDRNWLAYLFGGDAQADQFLFVPTTDEEILALTSNQATLLSALRNKPVGWTAWMRGAGQVVDFQRVDPGALPANRLPGEGLMLALPEMFSPTLVVRPIVP